MIDGVITGVVNASLFALVVLIRRLVHHEGLAAFGLHADARGWRLFACGVVVGALLFSIYPVASVALHAGTLTLVPSTLTVTSLVLAGWGFGFAGVALFEESLFRGYLLPKLRSKIGSSAAVASQAVLFAAFHLSAYSRSPFMWLGLVNATGLGMVLGMLVLRTGSLMPAFGFHAAWDLVQTVLLFEHNWGVPTAINLRVTQGLWTGTADAPETGLIVTLAVGALALLILRGATGGSLSSRTH